MKQAIVHFGFNKTGSSSIQKALRVNAQTFFEQGWFFPIFSYKDTSIQNHSISLFGLYSKNAARYHVYVKKGWNIKAVTKQFRSQLQNALEQPKNLILSGEDLSNLPIEALRQLKADIENAGYHIRPIAFVRSPLADCSSRIQQRVKGGVSISDALASRTFSRSTTLAKVERMQSVFENTEFYAFDQVNQEGGATRFFVKLVGLDPDMADIDTTANSSVSMPAARLISHINQCAPLMRKNKINVSRNFRDTNALTKLGGEKFCLLQSEVAPHLEALHEEHRQLEEKLNLKFAATNAHLLTSYPASYSWSDAAISNLLPLLPKLSPSIIIRIYDYFTEQQRCDGISSAQLDQVASAVKQQLAIKRRQFDKAEIQALTKAAKLLAKDSGLVAQKITKMIKAAKSENQQWRDFLEQLSSDNRNS